MSFYHDSANLRMLLGEEQLVFGSRLEVVDYVNSEYNANTYPGLKQRWKDKHGRYYVCVDGQHGVFDVKLPRNLDVTFPELYETVYLKRFVKHRGKRKQVTLEVKVLQVSSQRAVRNRGSICIARLELQYLSSEFS